MKLQQAGEWETRVINQLIAVGHLARGSWTWVGALNPLQVAIWKEMARWRPPYPACTRTFRTAAHKPSNVVNISSLQTVRGSWKWPPFQRRPMYSQCKLFRRSPSVQDGEYFHSLHLAQIWWFRLCILGPGPLLAANTAHKPFLSEKRPVVEVFNTHNNGKEWTMAAATENNIDECWTMNSDSRVYAILVQW